MTFLFLILFFKFSILLLFPYDLFWSYSYDAFQILPFSLPTQLYILSHLKKNPYNKTKIITSKQKIVS